MRHHTKDKGDLGVGHVIADCLKHGVQVAVLLSEHLPFDLIAISPDMKLSRLSVKYRAISAGGAVAFKFASSWSDRQGSHTRPVNRTEFDATAIYCPDNGVVYYVRNDEAEGTHTLNLRILPPKNNQESRVHMASMFEGPLRLFTLP